MYRSLWTSRAEDPLRGACALAGRPLRLHQGLHGTRAHGTCGPRDPDRGPAPSRAFPRVSFAFWPRLFIIFIFSDFIRREQETSDTRRIATRERRSTDDTWSDRTWDKSETRPSRAHRTGCRCRVCPRACGTPRPGCHWEIGWPLRSPTPLGLGPAHRTLLRIPALSQMLMRSPPRTRGRCSRLLSNSTSSPSAPRAATQPQHE